MRDARILSALAAALIASTSLAPTGCRRFEVVEREDAIRLHRFLAAKLPAYHDARVAERAAMAEILRVMNDLIPDRRSFVAERLRQEVLNPKHTYKALHDELNGWRLSGRAEEQRKTVCAHLKQRDRALLTFTVLLTGIRDAQGDDEAAVQKQIESLGVSARKQDPVVDGLTPVIEQLGLLRASVGQ